MDDDRRSVGHDYSAEDSGLDYKCQGHKLMHYSHFTALMLLVCSVKTVYDSETQEFRNCISKTT